MLHNQLLFERHRKDVHSERIRRILGRAKKSKIQEELIIALVSIVLKILTVIQRVFFFFMNFLKINSKIKNKF